MEAANHPYVNDVLLVGRLSREPVEKTLASGDPIMLWRLIVDRPEAERRSSRRVVDTFNCVAFDDRLFALAQEWQPDDMLEIRGSLRRRFWRGGLSQYEILVREANLHPQPAEQGGDAAAKT
jgi:single-stranded DNA-binding protein